MIDMSDDGDVAQIHGAAKFGIMMRRTIQPVSANARFSACHGKPISSEHGYILLIAVVASTNFDLIGVVAPSLLAMLLAFAARESGEFGPLFRRQLHRKFDHKGVVARARCGAVLQFCV